MNRRRPEQFDLAEGWTWIGHSFEGTVPATSLLYNEGVERIVGQSAEAGYNAEGRIEGILEMLSPVTLYKVKTDRQLVTGLVNGLIRNDLEPVGLQRGWNWIGNFLGYGAGLHFANAENGDFIGGQEGFAIFDGTEWIGTLYGMEAQRGYIYRSESDKQIVYPSERLTGTPARVAGESEVNPHDYPQLMAVVTSLVDDHGVKLAPDSHEVSAYCGDDLRGVGRVVNGLVMMSVYGTTGEDIIVKVAPRDYPTDRNAIAKLTFGETLLGNLNEPVLLNVDNLLGIPTVGYGFQPKAEVSQRILRIHGIDLTMCERIEMFDGMGRRVMSEPTIPAGGHSVASLPDGVYIVTVTAFGTTTRHKVIID